MKLKNLKVAQKLALSFTLVVSLMLVLAALSYACIHRLEDEFALTAKDRYPKIVLAHTVKDELNEIARNMRNLLLMTDPARLQAEYANVEESAGIINDALAKLDRDIKSDKGREIVAKMMAVRAKFVTARGNFLAATKDGRLEEAKAMLLSDIRPVQLTYFATLDELIGYQGALMAASAEQSRLSARNAVLAVLALSGAALLLSIVIAALASRSITGPLGRAVGVARKVADGDLTSVIHVDTTEETGQLLQALQDMNANLLRIVGQVRNGTESMASASAQIASGNLDLSARTEQQAASLEETASSMEEMTSATRQNADNARQANVLAESASQVAQQGGAVVAQVVGTMNEINEASRKIVDIIAVIDGIAFQTNILALNAAVEAARAGEQGRGFAVVATEVRSLAHRSAEAAKEIKQLIGDSVQKVEFGTTLVADAGLTMDQIVASIRRVTDIMGEIGAASREQDAGIEQINQAIIGMDSVTQQNAALVEQAAAASASLQQQSAELARVVEVFKLIEAPRTDGAAPRATRQRPRAAPRLAMATGMPG